MKIVRWGLLLAVLGCGCMRTPLFLQPWGTPEKPPPPPLIPPATVAPARPVPAVTADQVNESNAHAKCQALCAELDREESATEMPMPASVPPMQHK
jgi:hypothetical protein